MQDPQKIIGYDPDTGKPVIGYDPNTGKPVFAPQAQTPSKPAIDEATMRRYEAQGLPAWGLEPDKEKRAAALRADMEHNMGQARDQLAFTGGMIGSGAVNAGASFLPRGLQTLTRIAGQGAVGAGQAAASGEDPLTGAILGSGIEGTATALRPIGNAMYGQAMRIQGRLAAKYPGLAQKGIDHWIMPSHGGAEKAAALRNASMNEADRLVAGIDPSYRFDQTKAAQDAFGEVSPRLQSQMTVGNPEAEQAMRRLAFLEQGGSQTAQSAHKNARELNTELNNVFASQQAGVKPSTEQQALKHIVRATNEGLESQAPGLRAVSANTRDFEGLRQAASGRINNPATGLDDMGVVYGSATNPSAAPVLAAARAVRMPITRAATGASMSKTAEALKDPRVRAALLALLTAPESSHKK